jgi:hypothetical protein
METVGLEIAAAFGFRDRILGIDSGEREFTLSRFRGIRELERCYWAGWLEASNCLDNEYKWGASLPRRGSTGKPRTMGGA